MVAAPKQSENHPELACAKAKEDSLRHLMREMGSVLVAYSGGVDSAYLAYVASSELGKAAVSCLGISPSVSDHQRTEARQFAETVGLNLKTINTDEIADPHYAANPINRCYFCKSELYGKLSAIARNESIAFVLDGTNADDIGDHRPGKIAAGENGVRSPLAELGLTKSEIRQLSHFHGLKGWDKPASPCLSSRIAYGVPVTIDRLSKVERGESFLRKVGFSEFRVRVHDDLARIEIAPVEFERVLSIETTRLIAIEFKKFGFKYVALDLEGFRSGAMNEAIKT